MQLKGGPPPVGVMFDTALSRSEHVLAMAALYRLMAVREVRVASLSVSRADLRTAAFCDALARFLSGSSRVPPIGLSAGPQANPMAEAVLSRRDSDGTPLYPHAINKLNDTADVAASIRNGVSAQQPNNGAIIVAGPLTNLAAAMALPDLIELAPKRVRALAIDATTEDLRADLPSTRKVLANWPAPLVLVEVPDLKFPGAQLESRFAWTENHPVRDAYQAFQKTPYDAPLQSAAAVLYAVRPEGGLFTVSDPGIISVMDDGRATFAASAQGTHRIVRLVENQRDAAVQTLVELIAAQPPAPAGRGGGKQK